ncbi:hypothetical protein [Asticcacaulis sp. AC402]|uniref:hypothetical protein n=1 Tax=Asticcacaulis sp. AC402 TaxID=1282361 RepID=UPI0003C3B635|nr:hypothetical protein [Asticcacaulis sp. AC402]ESQ76848.1 cobalamin vitamin B12 biosynthesis CbiG protein [Asticcacaulis sp. AC402]
MQRLFGAYVIVDYSAAEGKKTGESSVWIGVMKRDVRFRLSYEAYNPATRAEAQTLLRTILGDLHKRGDRIFLGFAFPLGLVRGTTGGLQLNGWKGLWDFLAKNIVDKADNSNNRFQVAAKINRLITDEAWPFWGAPKNASQKWLSTLKPASFGDFPEFRLTEDALTGKIKKTALPKSLWQMHGAGVAGGVAMLGIVAVRSLLETLGDKARLWPFQAGFGTPELDGVNTVIAEVYPPMFEGDAQSGEVKDAAAVRITAAALAELDDKGQLDALFGAPKGLSEADAAAAAAEEGWILGA